MFQSFVSKMVGLILGVISAVFPFVKTNQKIPPPVSIQTATTTLTIETSTTTKITLAEATSTIATTSTKKSLLKKKPLLIKTKSVSTTTSQTLPAKPNIPNKPIIPFDQINTLARKALVNIYCFTKSGGPFSSISASGVIISSDGVILTNAHVGQYYLLKDFNNQKDFVQCVIRSGSPAYPAYLAELVFISPAWIEQNSKILKEQTPTGTGEHDYAFLKIISKNDGSAVDSPPPYLPISLDENINEKDNILLASYPAGFLGSITVERNLYPSTAISQISKVYTYDTNTVDLISIPGTVVSQKGSSGGAAISQYGQLTGLITLSSEADATKDRDLRAITMSYINRDLIKNSGINLKIILENSRATADTFNSTIAETLTKFLTDALLDTK